MHLAVDGNVAVWNGRDKAQSSLPNPSCEREDFHRTFNRNSAVLYQNPLSLQKRYGAAVLHGRAAGKSTIGLRRKAACTASAEKLFRSVVLARDDETPSTDLVLEGEFTMIYQLGGKVQLMAYPVSRMAIKGRLKWRETSQQVVEFSCLAASEAGLINRPKKTNAQQYRKNHGRNDNTVHRSGEVANLKLMLNSIFLRTNAALLGVLLLLPIDSVAQSRLDAEFESYLAHIASVNSWPRPAISISQTYFRKLFNWSARA